MKYTIKMKETEEGVSVWCPDLPGCASQGATEEEARENILDAIREYLEVAKELNEGVKTELVEIDWLYAETPRCQPCTSS